MKENKKKELLKYGFAVILASVILLSITSYSRSGRLELDLCVEDGAVRLSWSRAVGASGYEVFASNKRNGKYSKIACVKGGSRLSCIKTGLTKGKTYYFKVVAYRTVKEKRVCGRRSALKSVKVK